MGITFVICVCVSQRHAAVRGNTPPRSSYPIWWSSHDASASSKQTAPRDICVGISRVHFRSKTFYNPHDEREGPSLNACAASTVITIRRAAAESTPPSDQTAHEAAQSEAVNNTPQCLTFGPPTSGTSTATAVHFKHTSRTVTYLS
ncbi:hypothetical protein TcG_05144 [Trypanosoma cruzi]|nr:hypothetical protein TcG_05144 [Trypanosoma cruzi]